MKLHSTLRLIACLALCLGVGFVGSLMTQSEIPTWYAGLAKPSWTPPPIVFPIVWTTLYIMMAVSLWRLWESPSALPRRRALIWFLIQLALNAIWTPLFFGAHAVLTALIVLVLMICAVCATILHAMRVDRLAAWLLVPYLCWIAYASTLNAGVLFLN